MSYELELSGLDGGNPLAFLTALGTLRVLSQSDRECDWRMSWRRASAWRPVLQTPGPLTAEQVAERIGRSIQGSDNAALQLGDNLDFPVSQFINFVLPARRSASLADRTSVDFAAAFGSEAAPIQKNGVAIIDDTALRTMSGAGHQHFLGSARNIVAQSTADHCRKALFEPWQYDDPVRNLSMRWDPTDDARYALRWGDPSKDGTRGKRGGMLGANRLAIEALPLFPTAPVGQQVRTTGFRGRGANNTFWTWPIWNTAVSLDVVRTLLALGELAKESPDRDILRPLGIAEVFRSQRLTVGKFRSFAPARAV